MKSLKDNFLNKYNSDRTLDKALSEGIAAAVRHNSLYRKNLSPERKKAVRREWKTYLEGLVACYKTRQTIGTYEKDILNLWDIMNSRFSDAFLSMPHAKYNTDPGFRISHAQKSISVFLKHLWCMGIVATPPQCPVDSIILALAGARYPDTKWGYVNSLNEHRIKIRILNQDRMRCGDITLAEWELRKFKS